MTVLLADMGEEPRSKAHDLANQIAKDAYEYTGETLCVLIHYGYLNKFAKSCVEKGGVVKENPFEYPRYDPRVDESPDLQ